MSGTLLFLGRLPNHITQEEVHRHLSIYGKITDVKVRPGFGFVRFASEKDAKDVVTMFAQRQFLGADVAISVARPYTQRKENGGDSKANTSPVTRTKLSPRHDGVERYPVLVKKMNPNTTWKELMHFGRLAGDVLFVALDKHCPGRGYINYLSQRDAEYAVKKLNGRVFLGNVVGVTLHQDRSAASVQRSTSDSSSRGRSRSRSPARRTKAREDLKHNDYRRRSDPRNENKEISRESSYRAGHMPTKSDSLSVNKQGAQEPHEGPAPHEPFQKPEPDLNTGSVEARSDTDIDRIASEWLDKHFNTEAWRNALAECFPGSCNA